MSSHLGLTAKAEGLFAERLEPKAATLDPPLAVRVAPYITSS